jgi:hypothetical protein
MGSRYKTLDQKMKAGIPGPGEYKNDLNKSIPSVKFGTSNRSSFDATKLKVPGPGEYVGSFENIAKAAPKYG